MEDFCLLGFSTFNCALLAVLTTKHCLLLRGGLWVFREVMSWRVHCGVRWTNYPGKFVGRSDPWFCTQASQLHRCAAICPGPPVSDSERSSSRPEGHFTSFNHHTSVSFSTFRDNWKRNDYFSFYFKIRRVSIVTDALNKFYLIAST